MPLFVFFFLEIIMIMFSEMKMKHIFMFTFLQTVWKYRHFNDTLQLAKICKIRINLEFESNLKCWIWKYVHFEETKRTDLSSNALHKFINKLSYFNFFSSCVCFFWIIYKVDTVSSLYIVYRSIWIVLRLNKEVYWLFHKRSLRFQIA